MSTHCGTRRGIAALAFLAPFLVLTPPVSAAVDVPAAKACTETITGTHRGALTLSGPGTTCLKGAKQHGAITVSGAHRLTVVDSTVYGAITSTSSAAFAFCHSSTVRGAVNVSGSHKPVLIGSTSRSCRANVIDGAVTLNGNSGGVRLGRNRIAGGVDATSNLGGTIVDKNAIAGKLTCSANKPAPTNKGRANTVAGARVGQTCAAKSF